jgi:hypothetical protein
MTNKTAMMQMLEFINDLGNNYESKMHAVLCQEKAIELLEVEKEDLASVYWASYKEGQYSGDKTAEEYYKETYGKQDNGKL